MSRRKSPDSPLFQLEPVFPDFSFEIAAKRDGFWPVAGADEAGRGPLAGPVVAAAVILDSNAVPAGLNDSKLLTAEQREALFNEIMATATVSIASSSAAHIDATDILKASLDAMRRAIDGLSVAARFALIDGRDVPQGLACHAKAIIKGDSRSVSIAAASIVAKVTRDRMMARADATFPAYGFAMHAGYATVRHRNAIDSHGPCSLHRMSFRPFRQDQEQPVAISAEPLDANS
ncbi:ribonuclease HII [Sinorhizobium americanum]|uniref:Ribonuclease HII n=1 Tax=Sinorhizobium americanum TaxID=194963 RepID=A0A4R2B6X3_9HYPH|nr:ribonuclease HII [Sinorhizobium americanum]APG83658.1 ribonuclease HII [Sinorhizobium americanum CCGM7]TCN22441.1 RNase HII [Sinorhizobium americanum]